MPIEDNDLQYGTKVKPTEGNAVAGTITNQRVPTGSGTLLVIRDSRGNHHLVPEGVLRDEYDVNTDDENPTHASTPSHTNTDYPPAAA